MRYRVPQNIDMEDKIIGPLTMVQFVYLMLGGMVIYLAYLTLIPLAFTLVSVPVGLLTLALAFLKIQDQPFPKFVGATLLYMVRPKTRVWTKDPALQQRQVVTKQATTPQQKSVPVSGVGRGDLDALSQVLDTGGSAESKAATGTMQNGAA